MMTEVINRYLSKRSLKQNFKVYGSLSDTPQTFISVVIPVKDEYPSLIYLLKSLSASFSLCKNTDKSLHVICVVNNKTSDDEKTKENNSKCIQMLLGNDSEYNLPVLNITVLDCASEGYEIPENQGVGYARKLGMDFALSCGATTIACLDADTLVSENYCQKLYEFDSDHRFPFNSPKSIGAVVTDFCHQKGATEEQNNAILIYQNYMKEHSRKLKESGTIFYPVALGPTLVCTASAYIACGGMNLKTAGEDFYFLQSLIKISGEPLKMLECSVYPSARQSDRVPFGTGRTVEELCNYSKEDAPPLAVTGYPDFVYEKIQKLISLMKNLCYKETSKEELKEQAFGLLPDAAVFLENEGFFDVWEKLCKNNKIGKPLERAFQCWFDGLKIIRLIHFLLK